jgi:Two component regulator propeller
MAHYRTLWSLAALLPMLVRAQMPAIGEWRDHFNYRRTVAVSADGPVAYCATRNAIFKYDALTGETERFTKVNALSDVGIQSIRWNPVLKGLLVGYANGNLDWVTKDAVVNLGDIRRSNVVGDKTIYHIRFQAEKAFLGCGFGVVVVDLLRREVTETWYIGDGGTAVRVNATTEYQDSIYAATEEGLFVAWKNSNNLASFTNWKKRTDIPRSSGPFHLLAPFAGKLAVGFRNDTPENDDSLFVLGTTWSSVDVLAEKSMRSAEVSTDSSFLVVSYAGGALCLGPDLQPVVPPLEYFSTAGYMDPAQAVHEGVGHRLWLADKEYGLQRMEVSGDELRPQPNGPKSNNARRIAASQGHTYVATGGNTGIWTNLYWKEGVHRFKEGSWRSMDLGSDALLRGGNFFGLAVNDFMNVAIDPQDPQHAFVGTWDDGIVEMYDGRAVALIGLGNSSLQEDVSYPGDSVVRVAGLDFDDQGDLWVSNANCPNVIAVRTSDNNWRSFAPGALLGGNFLVADLLAASNGFKWVVRPRGGGLLVMNDGGTVDDISDDQYRVLNNQATTGGLPSADVFCLAEDKDGEIWVGTGQGPAIFYAPDAIFSGDDYDAQQIRVEAGNVVELVLASESINAIAVDGADRKWLGTNSGLYVLSDDGTEQLMHLTTENSPLPSNIVLALAIDDSNGEVFIGTDVGLMSYRSDALGAALESNCATVFPNPVQPTYSGPIAITGLVADSQVRITDLAGNVVFRTRSLGGQAIWPGTDLEGNRVATGVYVAMASDMTGKEACNTKILVVR